MRDNYIFWLEVAMNDLLAVDILQRITDTVDNFPLLPRIHVPKH